MQTSMMQLRTRGLKILDMPIQFWKFLTHTILLGIATEALPKTRSKRVNENLVLLLGEVVWVAVFDTVQLRVRQTQGPAQSPAVL